MAIELNNGKAEITNANFEFIDDKGNRLNDFEFLELGQFVLNQYDTQTKNKLKFDKEFFTWLDNAVKFAKEDSTKNPVERLHFFKNQTIVNNLP